MYIRIHELTVPYPRKHIFERNPKMFMPAKMNDFTVAVTCTSPHLL